MFFAINELLLTQQNLNNITLPKNTIIFKNLEDIPKSNTFIFSSIKDCKYLQTMHYGIVKYFNLKLTEYIAHINEYFLNSDGYFKLTCQLDESDINKFCRSNSGNKVWSGQVINDKIDLAFIKQQLQQDTLLFLSSKKDISQEVRCWMINGKCIEITKYTTWNIEQRDYTFDLNDYIKFAEYLATIYEPDDMYVIDLGVYNNKIYIIEYNCFSTSGFYTANIEKIINGINFNLNFILH